MHEEVGTGEPTYLELADALELYAAITSGTPAQAADQLRDQGVRVTRLTSPNRRSTPRTAVCLCAATAWCSGFPYVTVLEQDE